MESLQSTIKLVLILFFCLCTGADAQSTLAQPVTIPLRLVMAGESERLSIPIRLGDSPMTGSYLFDTGSSPLVAAYVEGAPWWGTQFTPTDNSRVMHYVATGFRFSTVQTRITVGSGDGAVSSSPSFPVDQALSRMLKRGGLWVDDPKWAESLQSAVRSGVPPEDGGRFYGTMGADLANPAVGLYRLATDVTTGSVGDVTAGYALEGGLANSRLTIGLTLAIKKRFPILIPINRINGKFAQKVITADFVLEYRGRTYPIGRAGVVLDTGAPRTSINTAEGFSVPPELVFGHLLRRGVALHMRCGSLSWTLVAGPGHRIAVGKASAPGGGVNSGIHFFDSYNVMFDIQNGNIGFAPVR